MKIVIDIPEEDFEKVKCGRGAVSMMRKAIIHGTPLPKGHGRLIDADALYDEYVKEPEEFNGGHSLMALFRAAPTIVEANKESEI